MGRKLLYPRLDADQGHHHHGKEKAGSDAPQEQIADGGARYDAVEHHGGRNDRPQDRRGGGERRGEARPVAGLDHHLDRDFAGPGGVRQRATAHAGKDDARDNVDMSQAASEPADQQIGETEHLVGHRAGIHQLGRKDEQRHGEHDEIAVDAIEALARHQADIASRHKEIDDAGREHGVAERHADGHPHEEGDEHDLGGEGHGQTGQTRGAAASPSAKDAKAAAAR